MLRFTLIALVAISTLFGFGLPVQANDLAKPVLVRGTTEYKFRTKLRECASNEGVNFNHHYTVCTIGQGTDFQIIFIIDRNTGKVKVPMYEVKTEEGKVVDAPVTSELGIKVSDDSDILEVNPDFWMSPGDPVPAWLWRKFYKYNKANGKFVLIDQNQEQSPRPAN